MNKRRTGSSGQAGLSLVEMLIAMALGLVVMSGVLAVLLASKSSFVSARELAGLQENARYALRLLGDSLRMAGFSACPSGQVALANSIHGASTTWYLTRPGIEAFGHSQSAAVFPEAFRKDALAGSDALVLRRAEEIGLRISNNSYQPESAQLPLNRPHALQTGEVLLLAALDCKQVAIFQMSGPPNSSARATSVAHQVGGGEPGNCSQQLWGNFDCSAGGELLARRYPPGSRLMRLRSEAFYVGESSTGDGIPALFREYLYTSQGRATTRSEELVQGVESLQLLFGVDSRHGDGHADIYLAPEAVGMNWGRVVSVRLFLRMRSINPVYERNERYERFRGTAGSDGADRFLRQLVISTIQLRNR